MRIPVLAAAGIAAALALGACSSDSDGAGPTSGGDESQGQVDEHADQTPAGAEEDFVTINGVKQPFSFSGFTLDESDVRSRAILRQCEPNLSRTGMFIARGYLVDDNNAVTYFDKGFAGFIHVVLPIDDRGTVKPSVQIDIYEQDLALSTDVVPIEQVLQESNFVVNGNSAHGTFTMPDVSGGAAQQVEFAVTCPAQ